MAAGGNGENGSTGVEVGAAARSGASATSDTIQLFDSAGNKTFDLDGELARFDLGGVGNAGDQFLQDDTGTTTIHLDGARGNVSLSSNGIELDGSDRRVRISNSSFDETIDLRGDDGRVQLMNSAGDTTVELHGENAQLELRDAAGDATIRCRGDIGLVKCVNLTEVSDARLKTDVAPLADALDRVMALRGVRYRPRAGASSAAVAGGPRQVGFVGQEVEAVCPELVVTDTEGCKSVSYTRMTAVLVEAVKEQQGLIRAQAAALEALSDRLAGLSTAGSGTGGRA